MTFMNARNPSVTIRWSENDDPWGLAAEPAPLDIRPEPKRLAVGSQLNGLDEILESARRRSRFVNSLT